MITYLLTGLACGLILSLIIIFVSIINYKKSLINKAEKLEPLKIKNKQYYVIESNKYLRMEAVCLIANSQNKIKGGK